MKEFTTNDIVKTASAEQLDKLFKLSHELGDVIEQILVQNTSFNRYTERLAYCPDFCKVQMLETGAMAEMSNRAKNK